MRVDCNVTENYLKEKARMVQVDSSGICTIKCLDCPISSGNNGRERECLKFERSYPLEAIALVQEWSDEHQEMTSLDYLLKHFPNTKLDEDGTPAEICPDSIGLPIADGLICKGNHVDCKKCWSVKYEEK